MYVLTNITTKKTGFEWKNYYFLYKRKISFNEIKEIYR